MNRKICILGFLKVFISYIIGFYSLSALAQDHGWSWGHGGMMGEDCGMWGMGILGWVIMILVIVVLFLAAVWLIKQIKK